jgi:hypothetical protein
MWTPALTEDTWLQIQEELTGLLALQEDEPPGIALLREQLRTLRCNRVDNGASFTRHVTHKNVALISCTVGRYTSQDDEGITADVSATLVAGTSDIDFRIYDNWTQS